MRVVAELDAGGAECGAADCDLGLALRKDLNRYNDIFKDRRPEAYA